MGELNLGKWGALQGLGEGVAGLGKHFLNAQESQKDRDAQTELRQMLIDSRTRENALDRTQRKTNADRLHERALAQIESTDKYRIKTLEGAATDRAATAEYRGKMLEATERHRGQQLGLSYAELQTRLRISNDRLSAAEAEDYRAGKYLHWDEGEDIDTGKSYDRVQHRSFPEEGYFREWMDPKGGSLLVPDRDSPEMFAQRMAELGKAPEFDLEDMDPGGGRDQARAWGTHNLRIKHEEFMDLTESLGPRAREKAETEFKNRIGHLPFEYLQTKHFLDKRDRRGGKVSAPGPEIEPETVLQEQSEPTGTEQPVPDNPLTRQPVRGPLAEARSTVSRPWREHEPTRGIGPLELPGTRRTTGDSPWSRHGSRAR